MVYNLDPWFTRFPQWKFEPTFEIVENDHPRFDEVTQVVESVFKIKHGVTSLTTPKRMLAAFKDQTPVGAIGIAFPDDDRGMEFPALCSDWAGMAAYLEQHGASATENCAELTRLAIYPACIHSVLLELIKRGFDVLKSKQVAYGLVIYGNNLYRTLGERLSAKVVKCCGYDVTNLPCTDADKQKLLKSYFEGKPMCRIIERNSVKLP